MKISKRERKIARGVVQEAADAAGSALPQTLGQKLELLAHLIGASLIAMQPEGTPEDTPAPGFVLLVASTEPDEDGHYDSGTISSFRDPDDVRAILTAALHATYRTSSSFREPDRETELETGKPPGEPLQ